MDLPKIQPEMFSIIAQSESRTESSSGANTSLVMGGSTPGHSQGQIGRSAAGAGGIMQAANDRLGGLVEDFNRQVFKPFLWEMHEMNRNFLPPSVYRAILGEKLGDAFKVQMRDFMKAGIKSFDVLAGAHMAVKQQMAQSMPLIMQYFMSPQLANQVADINEEYIDFSELIHMLTDVGGWGGSYYSIMKPLTPAMKQKRQANSPAALAQIKAQGQVAAQKQRGDSNLQAKQLDAQAKEAQLEQSWTGRAAGDIIRHAIETSGQPESIQGAPGGTGFGGNELEG